MCTIQRALFVVNGNIDPPSCNALPTDKVEVDITVTFTSAEIGKTVKVGPVMIIPDGTEHLPWASTFRVPSAGTYDFVIGIPVDRWGNGNYRIIRAEVWDYNAGSLMCSGGP